MGEESDDESDFDDMDSIKDDGYGHYTKKKRQLIRPDDSLYSKERFVLRVDIVFLLCLGKPKRYDNTKQNRKQKCKKVFSGQNIMKDVRVKAIRMENDSIQSGDCRVLTSMRDNPVLKESVNYVLPEHKSNFNQGWGRRITRSEKSSVYGETFIAEYNLLLKKFLTKESLTLRKRRMQQL